MLNTVLLLCNLTDVEVITLWLGTLGLVYQQGQLLLKVVFGFIYSII